MPRRFQYDVVIGNGTSLSNEADIRDKRLSAIEMPAAWTAASIVLQVASVTGGTFGPLKDDAGNYFEVVCAAGDRVSLRTAIRDGSQWRFVKVESVQVGTPGTAVNQGADRTVRLIGVEDVEA